MYSAAAFLTAGIASALYFPALCADSRRWNPTFASFWAALGAALIAAGVLCAYDDGWTAYLTLPATAALVCFLSIEKRILYATQRKAPDGLDYVIVLGARVNGRRPSAALLRRIKRAEAYLRSNKGTRAIVSGGQGAGEEISEALAMRRALVERGIDPMRILLEDKSSSTEENLMFSGRLLDLRRHRVGLVTNDFHIYRSVSLAKRLGYRYCCGVPADSGALSFPNYIVREGFAVAGGFLRRGKGERYGSGGSGGEAVS